MSDNPLSRREVAFLGFAASTALLTAGATSRAAAAAAGGGSPASNGSGSIGLAPTARSVFAKHSVDAEFLESVAPFDVPFNPGAKIRAYSAINQPNCQVIVEDFLPGAEFTWVFPHDEFQYCISGEMQAQIWLPPLYSEPINAHMRAGDVYTYPVGARKHVKVTGTVPYRHLCFCAPSPGYPFPDYRG